MHTCIGFMQSIDKIPVDDMSKVLTAKSGFLSSPPTYQTKIIVFLLLLGLFLSIWNKNCVYLESINTNGFEIDRNAQVIKY